MIIKNALRSLQRDKARKFFLFLTFFVTTFFLFLFFNMSFSEQSGAGEYRVQGGMVSTMDVIKNADVGEILTGRVIIMSAADMIFANSFFTRKGTGTWYHACMRNLLWSAHCLSAVPDRDSDDRYSFARQDMWFLILPLLNRFSGATFAVKVQPEAMLYFVVVLVSLLVWIRFLTSLFPVRQTQLHS